MGSACCCLRVEDFDEYYSAIFRRAEVHALPSSIPGVTHLGSSGLATPSPDIPDTFHSPPRPLPYDADPRCSRLQRGLVLRREKASSHFHEESEPLRTSDSNSGLGALGAADKLNGSDHEGGLKVCRSGYTSAKVTSVEAYMLSSSEDEDVCPTCLEEYTPENPKIMTQCSHHFHLGCIYEWMERSETCPVCGKVMLFDETT
ncbi:E3 ubiquitin-protein ligase At3g02290 isoform X2 [Magnolia sinica]|uniref:E3 ubiquitin-protein ligase At3g02290 isoform X2 n=1 Tax=Magnolia sinica TaxID=86752 RepID=UPI0026591A05|nr:E3 ubiquitin-protein ligase At3g02290 isoform X2 [Magnolia sinica]